MQCGVVLCIRAFLNIGKMEAKEFCIRKMQISTTKGLFTHTGAVTLLIVIRDLSI